MSRCVEAGLFRAFLAVLAIPEQFVYPGALVTRVAPADLVLRHLVTIAVALEHRDPSPYCLPPKKIRVEERGVAHPSSKLEAGYSQVGHELRHCSHSHPVNEGVGQGNSWVFKR